MKKDYLIILIIQITETLGFSLILPFLPLYAKSLGASPLTIGLILTSFSICQFVSAPIMGRLSDHYGRKPLLVFSQLSTFISFIILAAADSLWLIFLSRIIDGILGSNFTIAQAYLSDVSGEKERSQAFGLSGVAFGVGFLIGPAIGGFLAGIDYSIPSLLAALISLGTIIITLTSLQETVKRKGKVRLNGEMFKLKAFKKYLVDFRIKCLLAAFFAYSLAHTVWVSQASLFTEKLLGFGTQQMGLVLTYIGFLTILLRGVLLKKLIKIFGELPLQKIGIILSGLGLLLSFFGAEPLIFWLSLTIFALGTGLARPLLLASLSKQVSSQEQGSILGVANSLGSLSRIIGPLMGGAIINYFYPGFLGIAAGLIIAAGLVVDLKRPKIKVSSAG